MRMDERRSGQDRRQTDRGMTDRRLYWLHCRARPRWTLDQLAEETGLSRYQIHRMVLEYRRSIGEVILSDRKLRAYRSRGMTIRQIAEKEQCAVGLICKRLRRMGTGDV